MDKSEAERLVDAGREAAMRTILDMAEAIRVLTERVAELERKVAALTRNSSNSSKPPSSDGPQTRAG